MTNLEQVEKLSDHRDRTDRRNFSWRTFIFGYFRSRRRATRRGSEDEPVFTDWHHPWLFFLGTGTMLLSCMDAFFTLQLIDRGAIEMNPFMAMMIGRGTVAFASSKMLMTGLGILVLVFLSRSRVFNFMRTGVVLTVFFAAYACLVCYEFIYLLNVF